VSEPSGSDRLCIATVVSPDHFASYLPLMIYSALLVYPRAFVKAWVCGKVPDPIKKILDVLPTRNFQIYENAFADFPMRIWTCNALRHLLPEKELDGFGYVFISDADFVYVKTPKTLVEHYGSVIRSTTLPYAGARGPTHTGLKGKDFLTHGWTSKYIRVAEGTLMLKTPEWFDATRKAREYYYDIVKSDGHDKFDKIKPGSYREYGEVLLGRILRLSSIPMPSHKGRYCNEKKAEPYYRQIHLGDFKFKKRMNSMSKMIRILPNSNITEFAALEKMPTWKEISKRVCAYDKVVAEILHKARSHVIKRLAHK
jgi:hypothetical protein